jgi:hypothetical protein
VVVVACIGGFVVAGGVFLLLFAVVAALGVAWVLVAARGQAAAAWSYEISLFLWMISIVLP